jgi:zinc/manganese transport system substrate-binding protein
MRMIKRIVAAAIGMIVASAWGAAADDGRIGVVAAENFYGDVARQIGGDRVAVVSILNNRDQDPHLFETTPGIVRKVADARIVIFNGANYDPWMEKLLDAAPRSGRTVLNAASVVGRKAGDNPHLWYDPSTMPAVAKALAGALIKLDLEHAVHYEARLHAYLISLRPLEQKIAEIRAKYGGVSITATEPVFGYMANALKLTVRNERFQMAVMNGTEPAARDLAALEDDLKGHKVRVLLYNRQVSDNLTRRLIELARSANIAVVGITETEPAEVSYLDWMLSEVDALEKALEGPPP